MKSVNSNEIEVYDLLEDRAFDQLSTREQHLVLELMSAEEYAYRREILLHSSTAFTDMEEEEPAPLILPIQPKSFLQRPIPIYQLFMSIAAILIAFLLMVPFLQANEEQALKTEYITKVDTLYVEQVEYDTVVQVEEKMVYVETVKYVNKAQQEVKEEPRLLEVNAPQIRTNLDASSLENRGINMKSDPTSILIQSYQLQDEN